MTAIEKSICDLQASIDELKSSPLSAEKAKRLEELQREVDSVKGRFYKLKKEKENTMKKDYSKYYFEGSWYPKARIPLAVVRAYVRDHSSVTYLELKTIFRDTLQGSLGVVSKPDEVNTRYQDPHKRFYMNERIFLQDRTTVVVCSQWGAKLNFEKFCEKAASLGYEIEC